MDTVGMTRGPLANEVLERKLEIRDRVLVEELAKLHLAEQRAKLRGIDGEGLGSQLGERRVPFVHEVRDVVEEQRCRERRRRSCIDGHDAKLARPDRGEQLPEAGHVKYVLQDLAVRLEDHRKRLVAARDGEEIAGALALLPQRRALSGTPPRQEQRARRVLAEARREKCGRRSAQIRGPRSATPHRKRRLNEIAHGVRVGQQQLDGRRLVGTGEAHDDPVVRPEDVGLVTVSLADHRADRHRPRCVHARAEVAEDAHAPIAHVVEVALDNDRVVVRHCPGRRLLVAEVLQEIARGTLGQGVFGHELFRRLLRCERPHAPRKRSDRATELERTADVLAVPERHAPGHAGRGGNEHAILCDLLDPPT